MKKEENSAKEAFDSAALAEFFSCPGQGNRILILKA